MIGSVEFKRTGVDEDELLAALGLIAQLAGTPRRWLPAFSPSGFIDRQWRPHVVDTARGRLDRRAYELCASYELRSALRSGRVWVPDSRRHADPASYLLPTEDWERERAAFAQTVGQPLNSVQRLAALPDEQAQLLRDLERARDAEAEAVLRDGDLIVERDADQDEDGRLRKLIEPRLPEIDLADLLIEVDRWTGFSSQLVPLSGNRSRSPDVPCVPTPRSSPRRRTSA
jgi:hypothetical protein